MNFKEMTSHLSKKQLLLIFLGIGLLVATPLIFMNLSSAPPVKAKEMKKVDVNLLGKTDLEKENWKATAERQMDALAKEQSEMALKQKDLTDQLSSLTDQLKKKEDAAASTKPSKSEPVSFPPRPNTFPPQIPGLSQEKLPARIFPPIVQTGPRAEPIHAFGPEGGIVPAQTKLQEVKQDEGLYLPSGSFVKGMLLSGMDAPAGVNSSKEPHPVLIKLLDRAILPNRYRFDVKECFVIGEGYGDLSSERAFIRTTTLSCIRNDGSNIDTPMKGYVAGEDGKVGLRGRLVTKEGQILAKALVAGFAEGLGNVYRLSSSTISVSPLGATETISPDKALEAGAFSGISRSAETLSKYYIRMAERVFPVIEIDASRMVDVVVLQGKALKTIESEDKEK